MSSTPTPFDGKKKLEELLTAGVHFGHLTRRWNPKMKPYIFMDKNGIHIVDLKKTVTSLQEACVQIHKLVSAGEKILFVGTKKQAKDIVKHEAVRAKVFYVNERWLGGMLTNFSTIRKSIKHMKNIEKKEIDGTFEKITKKERLTLERTKLKLKKILEGIEDMRQLPGAVFVVDVKKEHIAVKEANVLGIPVFAIVDTNCDPDQVKYVIPGNDDASKSIQVITQTIADAIVEANQHAAAKEKEKDDKEVDIERVKDETRIKYEESEQFKKFEKAAKEEPIGK